jgi:glycosyltransferase involved in cell wall biosynthesis
VRNFEPVGGFEIPEYRQQKLFYPPLLEMLRYCHEQGFTHIQSATPGPVGLAALAISKILELPFSGTYHTAFPQYAFHLTGDRAVESATWRFMVWYYDQMEAIHVSSQASAEELTANGIDPAKIKLIPRGIDIDRFHPSRRSDVLAERYGIDTATTFLYVGRVSKEKNLDVLVDAFRQLARARSDVHLMVVGDGPYLDEMRGDLADSPATFSGYLTGDELAQVYASADVFVFPSTTDTFGNVVLEAQAAGIPVVVTDQGGPCENLLTGRTGTVVPGHDPAAFAAAMGRMAQLPEERRRMGVAAREYMVGRSFESQFLKYWEMFGPARTGTAQRAAA